MYAIIACRKKRWKSKDTCKLEFTSQERKAHAYLMAEEITFYLEATVVNVSWLFFLGYENHDIRDKSDNYKAYSTRSIGNK